MQKLCLKPQDPLRRQLLVSFGSSAFLTLAFVVALASITVHSAGHAVKERSNEVMRDQVVRNIVTSTRNLADQFTAYLLTLDGTVQLMAEFARDRIVGYGEEGWDDDRYVPFFDIESQTNKYPLRSPPLPLDWQINPNIVSENAWEHLQERTPLNPEGRLTSQSSSFAMQGTCDPNITDSNHFNYYPNCTDENNNILTGGKVQPVSTAKAIYDKAGDLNVFLKPLFESQRDAYFLGIYFHNAGAGATLTYPGVSRGGYLETYESGGCDWMRNTNPYTKRPFGTDEEIGRCHMQGTVVSEREFNPMEEIWCQEMALHPEKVVKYGPYTRANSGNFRLMSAGTGIFDRKNGNFIGCAAMKVPVDFLAMSLSDSLLVEDSIIAVVRFDNGHLVADSNSSYALFENDGSHHISETGMISTEQFETFRSIILSIPQYTETAVRDAMAKTVLPCEKGGLISAYPLPTPPIEYDPQYKPDFLMIQVIGDEIFLSISKNAEAINADVRATVLVSAMLGFTAVMIVLAIVWCVSRVLTRPLSWIEGIAWQIVNHSDCRASNKLLVGKSYDLTPIVQCAPTSEITDLVIEFRRMIEGFSGGGASIVAEPALVEIRNELTWQSDFRQLYCRDQSDPTGFSCVDLQSVEVPMVAVAKPKSGTFSSFVAKLEKRILSSSIGSETPPSSCDQSSELDESRDKIAASIVPAPNQKHRGKNVLFTTDEDRGSVSKNDYRCALQNNSVLRSALFWWILLLLVVPLITANVIICAIVSANVERILPSWVSLVAETSITLEIEALMVTVASKAVLALTVLYEPMRDLHLLTRVSGWLLFDGIRRSVSFTEADKSSTEECKTYFADQSCPFYSQSRAPCPCDWEEPYEFSRRTCTEGNHTGLERRFLSDETFQLSKTRSIQKRFVSCQARDTDAFTGNRNSSQSFPTFDYSPETTLWWNTFDEMPGSEQGADVSGFATTYARARVSSAMAVVDFPIYNYAVKVARPKINVATYLGFEGDGLLTGFSGCRYSQTALSSFSSRKTNQASELAPDLCPLGKYGYDPRCRPWYASGKAQYLSSGSMLHVTAPYFFLGDTKVGTTVTAPVVNPNTDEFAGMAGLDFYPEMLRRSLATLNDLTSFIITPTEDVFGGDTVVAPNNTQPWMSASIVDLLFQFDEEGSQNREYFRNEILPRMRNGEKGCVRFKRNLDDGGEQVLILAFYPVFVRELSIVDPSDFGRGAITSGKLVYSVGIFACEGNMRMPFEAIEEDVDQDLRSKATLYFALVAAATFVFTVFAFFTTVMVTEPVILLLQVIQDINNREVQEDVPPLRGGSKETRQVYNSFAKLYKIVQISNTAFFSGNLSWACHFLNDAIRLFRKVDDKKAIGVACNNLANVCYAQIHAHHNCDAGLNTSEDFGVVRAGLEHYDEAIAISEIEFEQATCLVTKAGFAYELADRLFNRGMFLLALQGDPDCPDDGRVRALADVSRARDLDIDTREFLLAHKLLLEHSEAVFGRIIRRIHGLISFHRDEELGELWALQELIEDADQLLLAAWNEPVAPLFQSVSRTGRLQQLEAAAIRLELSRDNDWEAARLAMRMFAEDEYLMEGSFQVAANALLRYSRATDGAMPFTRTTFQSTRSDFRKMLKTCKNGSVDIGKCLIFALEINKRWEDDPIMDRINANCLRLYDECCNPEDSMGLVASTTRGSYSLNLSTKSENEGLQRSTLDIATSGTSGMGSPSLPFAVQMVVDASASQENDSYVLLVADGCSSESYLSIKRQIERLKRERQTTIHFIILGLDAENEAVLRECQTMCTGLSKASFYMNVTLANVDAGFCRIAHVVSHPPVTNSSLQGLTTEKF
jgi:HAMP domain-containing protein